MGLCLVFDSFAVLSVVSSFVINLLRKRELVVLLLLSSCYIVTVSVLWFFLAVSWVGLQYVSVFFISCLSY